MSHDEEIATLEGLILKYKLFYYHPDLVHSDWISELSISDAEYDKLEERHLELTGRHTDVGYPMHKTPGRICLHKHSMSKRNFIEFLQTLGGERGTDS